MITIMISGSKTRRVAALYARTRFGYIMDIAEGATDKKALQAMLKVLEGLVKDCKQRIKDCE